MLLSVLVLWHHCRWLAVAVYSRCKRDIGISYPGCCCPKYCCGTAGRRGIAVYGVSGDPPRESMGILAPRPRANNLELMGDVMGPLARTPSPLPPIFLPSLDYDFSSLPASTHEVQ
ncbi:hypothetical protein PC110_g5971 [Phytophthora cactorum]|uniref:Secreted protein n=1 Tax=Phytophthora cactorum TaxID=29920 RepID=A0A329SLM0_9STRA|nr:hypothetical protein PC122_g14002 [Phytophthora cactorum]RAW37767.1 hypothetical protein PC110_g5971 [Phytophthora cactorum]